MPAEKVLDAYYLEARAKLLELAAIFDRIDRGGTVNDVRRERLRGGVNLLLGTDATRAEQIQELFSLPYEANWPLPKPRF